MPVGMLPAMYSHLRPLSAPYSHLASASVPHSRLFPVSTMYPPAGAVGEYRTRHREGGLRYLSPPEVRETPTVGFATW
eukprot:2549460-Rhodomonas_salina.7